MKEEEEEEEEEEDAGDDEVKVLEQRSSCTEGGENYEIQSSYNAIPIKISHILL